MKRLLLILAALALPAAGSAQTFQVAKYSIGGDGGTDYLTAEPGTGRVFVTRSTHVMVVDGATGKVIGDIPDTPRNHGVALAPKSGHGFVTSAGDSTVTMFDIATLAVIKKIQFRTAASTGSCTTTSPTASSSPITAVRSARWSRSSRRAAIWSDGRARGRLAGGAASDGKGKIFVNDEARRHDQVIDEKAMKVLASWPLAPCEGPTGIAYDRATDRIFSGCGKTSVVLDAHTGKVTAT
jgi:DNA-binding beta-propeller fold protein YncE